jgi:hypothetical protein
MPMNVMQTSPATISQNSRETLVEGQYEKWAHCHVNWTAIWVGALAALTMALLFGLAGIAVEAHVVGPEQRVVDLKKMGIATAIVSVCAAFFAFVIAGWVGVKVAGILHSEPAMLHGAIVWLVAVPLVIVMASLGAASFFDGWLAGLGGAPAWSALAKAPFERPEYPGANATAEEMAAFRTQSAEYKHNIKQWNEDTPKVARNSALCAITALLLGLMGSVIGGWMACGEPMNFTHYRTRKPLYHVS